MITSIKQLDLTKSYTFDDYMSWTFEDRVELIKGKIFRLNQGNSPKHQSVSCNIVRCFYSYIKTNNLYMYHAPFDVRMGIGIEHNVTQPDISIFCDENKLDDHGGIDSPDLIIEILSSGNNRREYEENFNLYEEYGVQEYWMVNPLEEMLTIYTLNEEGKYVGSSPFVTENTVHTAVLPGFSVTINQIFDL